MPALLWSFIQVYSVWGHWCCGMLKHLIQVKGSLKASLTRMVWLPSLEHFQQEKGFLLSLLRAVLLSVRFPPAQVCSVLTQGVLVLCTSPGWAELCRPCSTGALLSRSWLAWLQTLGLFVPMSMEVWESGFQKRGRKHLLNVARLFGVVQLGTESCFLPWLWSCSVILHFRGTSWWLLEVSEPLEQPSVQSPEELGDSCVSGAELGAKQGNNWGLEAAEVRAFHCCC